MKGFFREKKLIAKENKKKYTIFINISSNTIFYMVQNKINGSVYQVTKSIKFSQHKPRFLQFKY